MLSMSSRCSTVVAWGASLLLGGCTGEPAQPDPSTDSGGEACEVAEEGEEPASFGDVSQVELGFVFPLDPSRADGPYVYADPEAPSPLVPVQLPEGEVLAALGVRDRADPTRSGPLFTTDGAYAPAGFLSEQVPGFDGCLRKAVDLDGDGVDELFTCRGHHRRVGGSWTYTAYAPPPSCAGLVVNTPAVEVMDIDRDGVVDLVLTLGSGPAAVGCGRPVVILRGEGSGFVPEEGWIEDTLHDDNEKHVTPYFVTVLRPQLGARRLIVVGGRTEALGYGDDQLRVEKIEHSGFFLETGPTSGRFAAIHPFDDAAFQHELRFDLLVEHLDALGLMGPGFDATALSEEDVIRALLGVVFSPEELGSGQFTMEEVEDRFNALLNEMSGGEQCFDDLTWVLDPSIRTSAEHPMGLSWFVSADGESVLVVQGTFGQSLVFSADPADPAMFVDHTVAANIVLPSGEGEDSADIPWGAATVDFTHSGATCLVIGDGWNHQYRATGRPTQRMQAFCQTADTGRGFAPFDDLSEALLGDAPAGSWQSVVGVDIGHDGTLDLAVGPSFPGAVAALDPGAAARPMVIEDRRQDGRSATVKVVPVANDAFLRLTLQSGATRLFPTNPLASPGANGHPIQQLTWTAEDPATTVEVLDGLDGEVLASTPVVPYVVLSR